MKFNILNSDITQFQKFLEKNGFEKYRARQIFDNIVLGKNFDEMNNLSKELRDFVAENCIGLSVSPKYEQTSKDGTTKWGLELSDKNIIECVMMKYKYGVTICISSQVGCRMGCKFCASTINGLVRNLDASEMLSQIFFVNKYLGGSRKERKVTNIVLMGCGEPLDNYDNVRTFVKVISSTDTLNISQRNISLSTCGLVEQIYKLADEQMGINLTISLHAPNDDVRQKIMKVAKAYSIKDIMKACDYYFSKTHRRIYFEYTLCSGINDTEKCAKELVKLLSKRICHVNIINLNNVEDAEINNIIQSNANKFCKILTDGGLSATVRRTLGEDIDSACGQLRNKVSKK